MKTDKKSFLFYQSWKTQIDILDDSELRKFINNLLGNVTKHCKTAYTINVFFKLSVNMHPK